MFWFLLIALVAVVGAVTLVVVGGGDGAALPEAQPDRLVDPLPEDRPVDRTDVEELRLPLALRGYRMAEVDDALGRLGAELAERDARIAELEAALAGTQATAYAGPDLIGEPRPDWHAAYAPGPAGPRPAGPPAGVPAAWLTDAADDDADLVLEEAGETAPDAVPTTLPDAGADTAGAEVPEAEPTGAEPEDEQPVGGEPADKESASEEPVEEKPEAARPEGGRSEGEQPAAGAAADQPAAAGRTAPVGQPDPADSSDSSDASASPAAQSVDKGVQGKGKGGERRTEEDQA